MALWLLWIYQACGTQMNKTGWTSPLSPLAKHTEVPLPGNSFPSGITIEVDRLLWE